MSTPFELVTPRLLLRPFEERDRAPFRAMNLDPEVMRFFGSTLPPEKSDEHMDRYARQLERDGFSFLTLEHRETHAYLGTVGMQVMSTIVPGLPQPAVEVGWRLVREAHGHGYATEAAAAIVEFAFTKAGLNEVLAITATGNLPSRHVMKKLGMTFRPEFTFDHPIVPEGHEHRQHLVYTLRNPTSTASLRS